MSQKTIPRSENRILASLPAEEYERLLPQLKSITLNYKQVLYEPHKPLRYAYFPEDSIISMVSTVVDKAVPLNPSCLRLPLGYRQSDNSSSTILIRYACVPTLAR